MVTQIVTLQFPLSTSQISSVRLPAQSVACPKESFRQNLPIRTAVACLTLEPRIEEHVNVLLAPEVVSCVSPSAAVCLYVASPDSNLR
jgi:hypothetical protein